jgi:uncharacterized membrane protein YphA (DoxX/SURF4 family)
MSSPAERALEASPWTVPRIVAFRFMFAYVVLYCFPQPLEMVPKLDWLAGKYGEGLVHLAAWLGARLLGIEVDPDAPGNGSGDRTIDYLLVFTDLLLATLATVVWSLIDRRRPHHRRLAEGLWIYVRYVLALTMIAYGLAKVFKSQFPFPSPARLAQPIGNTSPMGILWTFMGYSTPYNVFTGGMECLGGVLLFSRRTTTLGALVIVGVMTNVVALNFCYDVPVKLYSTHLLLLAVGLAAPDLRRLANVLILNRPTTPRPPAPPIWYESTVNAAWNGANSAETSVRACRVVCTSS